MSTHTRGRRNVMSAGVGRRVLLLWEQPGVLQLRHAVEPGGVGEGRHFVELCAVLRRGAAEAGHTGWLEWAAAW